MSVSAEMVKRDNPEEVKHQLERLYKGRRMRLKELFHGDQYEAVREAIVRTGRYQSSVNGRTLHVATVQGEDPSNPEVVAIAAVSRDPGLTQDAIDLIQDFADKTGGGQRAKQIRQYWDIYNAEGIVWNAIGKYASLLSVGGSFKVRRAKKGKQQKAVDTAQQILDFWCRNVNGPIPTGVATASRGVKALTEQGIRVALVEGDWMGRQVWGTHQVGTIGTFSLPMTIQTISMEVMEPVNVPLQGVGEMWYWSPSSDLLKLIRGEDKSQPKEVKDLIKRLFDNDITKQLRKADKALLTSALLLHVKHRGSDRAPYGESFIEPAKLGIRYARAVTNTDMVSMESIIDRLMIIQVGSSDPKSPYADPDVAAARASVMQAFFEDPGPNMTIVWQGDDVKVESFGAMDALLDLKDRFAIGERKILVALGIPKALLDGTADDGKAAGWASIIAASGMAESLGSAFETIWTVIGERILFENGFVDVDIVFEFDRTNLADRNQERTQNRSDYIAGGMTIRDYIAGTGKDPDAWYIQRCFEKGVPADPATFTWEMAAMPPQGLAGQGGAAPPGQGPGKDPGAGRPPNSVNPTPAKPPTEKTSPVENK